MEWGRGGFWFGAGQVFLRLDVAAGETGAEDLLRARASASFAGGYAALVFF